MNELVTIRYSGKDYIGQIGQIDAELIGCDFGDGTKSYTLNRYRVTLIEKDTNCEISNIFVESLFDIKPYDSRRDRCCDDCVDCDKDSQSTGFVCTECYKSTDVFHPHFRPKIIT